jgi:hypothetical protein
MDSSCVLFYYIYWLETEEATLSQTQPPEAQIIFAVPKVMEFMRGTGAIVGVITEVPFKAFAPDTLQRFEDRFPEGECVTYAAKDGTFRCAFRGFILFPIDHRLSCERLRERLRILLGFDGIIQQKPDWSEVQQLLLT